MMSEQLELNSAKKRKTTPVKGIDTTEGGKKMKIFRESWLSSPTFKAWLEPHQDNKKALCRVCNVVLSAGISELMKHSQTSKHEQAMRDKVESQKRQLMVQSDSEDDAAVMDIPEDDDDSDDADLYEWEQIIPKAEVMKSAPYWKAEAVFGDGVVTLNLDMFRGQYLVMFFYSQNFSPLCPTELAAMNEQLDKFKASNIQVVACSVDSILSHQGWLKCELKDNGGHGISIPLLSDPNHEISKAYGCYSPIHGYALRAFYIVDDKGILRSYSINDTTVARNIGQIYKTVRALQTSDMSRVKIHD